MWRHHDHQQPRRGFAEPQGRRPAKARVCEFFLEKMPHLVERYDHLLGLDRRLRQLAGFIADPGENGDVADAEEAGDRTKTHVAHGVEQQRQSFHRGRLAARGRHCEIASTGVTEITLRPAHNAVFPVVARAASLAANIAHGGILSLLPPMSYVEYG